jgi:hypothetical protein
MPTPAIPSPPTLVQSSRLKRWMLMASEPTCSLAAPPRGHTTLGAYRPFLWIIARSALVLCDATPSLRLIAAEVIAYRGSHDTRSKFPPVILQCSVSIVKRW